LNGCRLAASHPASADEAKPALALFESGQTVCFEVTMQAGTAGRLSFGAG
jgi:hypothetical protein